MRPQDDLIDFPCSDLFRDHYAAQGMTFGSGRYARRPDPPKPDAPPDETGTLGELLALLRDQERKIAAFTAEIARLKTMLNKEDASRQSFEGLE